MKFGWKDESSITMESVSKAATSNTFKISPFRDG